MKILHLIPHLSGGGAERQLSYLAPSLANMGHDVHIAHTAPADFGNQLEGVTLHCLRSVSNYDPFLLIQLLCIVRKVRPDIIHSWILQMDFLAGVIVRLTKIPWVIREPSSAMAYPPTWKNRSRVFMASKASMIVSNSVGGDQYWASHLPHISRAIVRNGLQRDKILTCNENLSLEGIDTTLPMIVYVGRLTSDASASKNLVFMLEALSHLKKNRKFVAILCGEGPQRGYLEELSTSFGLNNEVRFTGYLPAASVWTLVKKASVFVSLSAYEGCPNTVMEAMVCGCPLVLSDIPAHREILDESSALFVKPEDVLQAANAIQVTLDDVDGARQRALTAQQKSQAWSIAEMSRSYEEVYKSLL